MYVYCRTNLDLEMEQWPSSFSALPRVGDLVESGSKHKNGFRLQLKVVRVVWKRDGDHHSPYIDLHINQEGLSIRDFYEWYAPLVGRSVSAFI